MTTPIKTYKLKIEGLVQGVGFRPFIYRTAVMLGLKGTVENRNDGVFIILNCSKPTLDNFIEIIKNTCPPASYINSIQFFETKPTIFTDFSIVKSSTVSDSITDISPDIAVCKDCLVDMKAQPNRIGYPFINCTNCGPRFTIIEDLPYDREKTSMKPFAMCAACNKEYTNIHDRRFHAQPIACSVCGPEYSLHTKGQEIKGTHEIIDALANLIDNGKIAAIKGMGGFFIACDALNEEAVARLRRKKKREGKPFAVMFKDIENLKHYAKTGREEESSLSSFRRPIVLLDTIKPLAPSVALGFNTLGAMLPYMPIHYLLFEKLKTPVIVLTSGNISDEPIVIDNDTALKELANISDTVLTYNRAIFNRTDDSVVKVINGRERLFRRSRGYVPAPILTESPIDGILACGAELTNCFALGRENKVLLSQHIGDLKNYETYTFYIEALQHFQKLYRFNPRLIVSDKHPDYLSTRYAASLGIRHIQVQHHHAHIAACMAEHHLNEKVIGIALDGTGYGDDGHIWGSEFLVCDFKNYERITHFEYIPLPGGDKVTAEPWRTAVSYLYKYFGIGFFDLKLDFLKILDKDAVELLCHAIGKGINSPLSCGAGRLFDAVAALINLCPTAKFHAEAPMRLEAIIDENESGSYPYVFSKEMGFSSTFEAIISDIKKGSSQALISTRFHNTIVNIISDMAIQIRKEKEINKVVLSGGTFQNKYILTKSENILRTHKFEVYSHEKVPTNDAGIALGQIMIAANIS